MIVQEKYPILEYDENPAAVLQPDFPTAEVQLPRRAVLAFLGDYVDRYAREHSLQKLAEYEMITGNTPIYGMEYEGEKLCLVRAPLGAPAAVMLLDWLFTHGVEIVLSTGSCGALTPIPENAFLLPVRALRDEGTSYHYLPSERFVDVHPAAQAAIHAALEARGVALQEVAVWTTDAFYRETPELVQMRVAEGCAAVDMECAGLAACAEKRGKIWGELLFTADSLASLDRYHPRGWGGDSIAYALTLCLDAAVRV